MPVLNVNIKHTGKSYDVKLDTDQPPAAFRQSIYELTGVPVDRMKVMIKGGILKDDTQWSRVAPKEGQTFTVIGAAGELPKPPEKPIVFMEDMDDSELAEALAKPVGLINLGNTCYMNATVQSLRAIPELWQALEASRTSGSSRLPNALNALHLAMTRTTNSFAPASFLETLRQVQPRFAEVDRSGRGNPSDVLRGARYAQQDAEECYGEIINSLRDVDGTPEASDGGRRKKFVEQYLMGRMRRELKCKEAPDEPASVTEENVLKIECNITITTNHLSTGILNALDQVVTKNSPSLGRDADYDMKSRLTRLPAYLTVHMVRFAWRSDIGKKAKIMRRVKFPTEYDALELVTDELKEKLVPVGRRLKDLEKERAERRKVRKRTKSTQPSTSTSTPAPDVEMADAATPSAAEGGELEPESAYRARELAELEALVHPDLKTDKGTNVHGLYELVAIVTHKGAAADSGHYIGFVKKTAFHQQKIGGEEKKGAGVLLDEDDEDWYKFDDDKVSVFPKDKLPTLEGGGEDSSAYVLLYRSKPLA